MTRRWGLEADFQETWTALETIENKLCTAESALEAADSTLDAIFTFDFAGTLTSIEAILQKECTVDSKLDVTDLLVDIFVSLIDAAQEVDLSGTFTVMDVILQKLNTIDSQVDVVDSRVDEICTALGTPLFQRPSTVATIVISEPGRYYLAEDILSGASPIIEIDSNDVFLDLNQHTITGITGLMPSAGVEIDTDMQNVVVTNGTIRNISGGNAISSVRGSNIVITNIKVDNASGSGIFLGQGAGVQFNANNVVKDCVIRNSGSGILAMFLNNYILRDNIIYDCTSGIDVDGALRMYVRDNVMMDCGRGINYDVGTLGPITAGVIQGNKVFGADDICIDMQDGRGDTIIDNSAISAAKNGLLVGVTNGAIVLRNSIIGSGTTGILLDNVDNAYVAFNTCIDNGPNFSGTPNDVNTVLGNFAFQENAVGNPPNANYGSSLLPELNGKFVTVSQSSSFLDRPTRWRNINMLP